MRRACMSAASMVRCLSTAAPLLYFPPSSPALPKDDQVDKNTAVSLELIKRVKGALPTPYTRKHTQTIDQIEKDIDALLGGAASLRKSVPDDTPMDKLTLMERCLRHTLWSYYKDEGINNFEEFYKWLVYTPDDQIQLSLLKHQVDLAAKQSIVRARRMADGDTSTVPLPNIDWTAEYARCNDRELLNEKRLRYDNLAMNTTDKKDDAIKALYQAYRKPMQDKRLDDLVDMLERFKPVLAREAIMQRLTIKHLEGQLGLWRYLDWDPEVRDRCELESDNHFYYWVMFFEERRLQHVRLRSKMEVAQIMSASQQAATATTSTESSTATTGDSTRDKLLKEVLALQARLAQRDVPAEKAPPKKKIVADAH